MLKFIKQQIPMVDIIVNTLNKERKQKFELKIGINVHDEIYLAKFLLKNK